MGADLEVLQGVVVHGVTVVGEDLLVDVYGSPANVCGSLRFTVADGRRRRATARLLRRWERASTPLTCILRGSSIALQNDAAVYGGQLPAVP